MKNFVFIISLLTFLFVSCKENVDTIQETAYGGTGLKPNSKDALEKVNEADIDEDAYGNALPAAFSLNGPPIIDQKNTSKCVAFSAGYYITSMYNGVSTTDLDKSGSPDFLYGQYKKVNNDNDCSEGCMLFDEPSQNIVGAAEILSQYGTTSWNQLPFIDGNSCAIVSNTNITQATNNKIAGYYRLDSKEFSDVIELKSWLYAGYPLFFGVNIDAGFQNLGDGDVWKSASGKSEGGHAMVIVGYDNAKNAFKIANSWGTDWASNGFGWVDYNYLITLLKKDDAPEIGILFPNPRQRIIMGTASPIACGSKSWGDIVVKNLRTEEIAIEMTGTNYNNTEMGNVDAKESQFFSVIPKGAITVKVLKADKSAVIKTYTVTVETCKEAILEVN